MQNKDVEYEFKYFFEVDFLSCLLDLKKNEFPSLSILNKTLIVIKDQVILQNIEEFIKISKDDYQVEDADVNNTIVFNRLVREETYRMQLERKRPIVFLEFTDKSPLKFSDTIPLGKVFIEL